MKVQIIEPHTPFSRIRLPLFGSHVPAGFPSPADDYIEDKLDLNEHLIQNPSATFYARASGNSMVNAGILDQALLIVDRSREPRHEDIVIAAVNGELTCKILDLRSSVLRAANLSYAPIPIGEDIDFIVQGVVIHVINRLCTHS